MLFSTFLLPAVLLAVAKLSNAISTSAGQTIVVNGISYYVPIESVTSIGVSGEALSPAVGPDGGDIVPITLLDDVSTAFTTSALKGMVGNFSATDDVFNIGFLQGMLTFLPQEETNNCRFVMVMLLVCRATIYHSEH